MNRPCFHPGFTVATGRVDKVDMTYTNYYIGKFITDNRYVAALTLGIGAIELYKEYISYKSKVKQERSSAGYAYLIEAQRQGIIR